MPRHDDYGVYGRAFLDSLWEHAREEYDELQASGDLPRLADEVEERAQSQFHSLLAQLQQQNPIAKAASYPERVAHTSGLAQQARELVLREVLEPAYRDRTANDAEDSYSHGAPAGIGSLPPSTSRSAADTTPPEGASRPRLHGRR
jgi:hypothetical protein